jgi:hypothetical protein
MESQEGIFGSLIKKAKDAISSATGSTSSPSYTSPTPSYTSPTTSYTSPTTSYGGKNKGRKRSRKMRGGAYVDNIALTGYAASAASISGGGKRRTKKCRRNKYTKSCKKRRR